MPVVPVVPVVPGAEAADWLAAKDASSSSRSVLIDMLAVLERQASWHAALQARVLAQLHEGEQAEIAARLTDGAAPVGFEPVLARQARDWLCEEVGVVMRLPGDVARGRMLDAAELVHRLPATLRLLESGAMTAPQARLLVEAVAGLTDQARARIEERVLVRAPLQTTSQFRRSLSRAVLANTSSTAEQAHADAIASRRVVVEPGEDGVGTLLAVLPAPQLLRVNALINGHAKNCLIADPDDQRSLDQRRADSLVELIDLGAQASVPGARSTVVEPKPLIQVVVGLSTLIGDSDEAAELAGFGPIPAALARRIASDPTGTWRRIVTDPIGRVVGYGRTRYKPPAELDQFVRVRDQQCTFPGCNRTAARAVELDHIRPWDEGGETEPDNLTALCARHHHLKHDGGWVNERDPSTGTVTWTSPTGHRYRKLAPELPARAAP